MEPAAGSYSPGAGLVATRLLATTLLATRLLATRLLATTHSLQPITHALAHERGSVT